MTSKKHSELLDEMSPETQVEFWKQKHDHLRAELEAAKAERDSLRGVVEGVRDRISQMAENHLAHPMCTGNGVVLEAALKVFEMFDANPPEVWRGEIDPHWDVSYWASIKQPDEFKPGDGYLLIRLPREKETP